MLSSTLVLAIDHTRAHTRACILSSPLLLSTSPFHVHQLGRSWSSKGRSLVISRARAHARPIATIGVVNPLPLLQSPCTPPSRPPPSIPISVPRQRHAHAPLYKGCRALPLLPFRRPAGSQVRRETGGGGGGPYPCVPFWILNHDAWLRLLRLWSFETSFYRRDNVVTLSLAFLRRGKEREEGKGRGERCTGRKADAGLNRSPSLYELTIITMAIKVYRSYRSIINRIIARSSNSAIAAH